MYFSEYSLLENVPEYSSFSFTKHNITFIENNKKQRVQLL